MDPLRLLEGCSADSAPREEVDKVSWLAAGENMPISMPLSCIVLRRMESWEWACGMDMGVPKTSGDSEDGENRDWENEGEG
jgi:hypothetical protein